MSPSTQPTIVLVRPTEEGNVGSTARAMANTGFSDLILVEPAVEVGSRARAFAVGAGGILDRAGRAPSLEAALAPFQRIVGTTSLRTRLPKVPVLGPRRLALRLASDPAVNTAFVFGPERSGLTTDELARCDLLVRISTSNLQPTLNLAQAVLILTYECSREMLTGSSTQTAPTAPTGTSAPARASEMEGLFDHLRATLEGVGFARDDTFEAALLDLRRLANRAVLSSREVAILRGLCRRTLNAIARGDAGRPTDRR